MNGLTPGNGLMPGANLPVLCEADAIVIGASFAGLACAVELARRGRRVAVVESRTYPGRELTATLRPWLELPPDTEQARLPLPIRYALKEQPSGASARAGAAIPLHPDRLKRSLEDMLTEYGVELLYAAVPIAVLRADERAAGLVVANKSGRQAILCPCVIDATETRLTAILCGEEPEPSGARSAVRYARTLEFTGVDPAAGDIVELSPDEAPGLAGNRIRLREGYLGQGHRLAEFELIASDGNSLHADRERETTARHLGIRLAAHLIRHVPAFRKAAFTASSHELFGPLPAAGDEEQAAGIAEEAPEPQRLALAVGGVYCLGKLGSSGCAALLDPVRAASFGERFAAALSADLPCAVASDGEEEYEALAAAGRSASVTDLGELVAPALIGLDGGARTVRTGAHPVPVLERADILVAGGGTSGACASITAAKEGMKTVLLELNPGLGGTGTYGGVDSCWFGRRVGYATQIADEVLAVQREIGYKGHKWNIEAKMYALLKQAEQAGVRPVFNAVVFGVAADGGRVCGALAATRWGAYAVAAQAVVDATGDGDLAALAGAEFVYGSEKDHAVMWYSLAQFRTPGKLQNNFTSMVDVSDIRDYTRAIVAGRRRGQECHDHGIYIAPRESRHVIGDAVMKLSDQLLHRRWPDVVNVHFSNHDVKGVSGAEWVNVGLIPPNLEIEMPYRMLLPRGLEGILVAGKAISATHDALPAIRMQSDLENLGAVAALAAAQAVRRGTTPRSIDIRELQRRAVQAGLIPESALTRRLVPQRYTDEELRRLAGAIESDKPLHAYADMRMNEVYRATIPFVEICSVGPRIVPFIESAMEQSGGVRKIRLAQALAMYGSKSAAPVLIEAIMQELSGEELPVRTEEIMYVQLPPDHGAMPHAANLLYSLAQTADARAVPVWQRVADLLRPDEADFRDTRKGIFYYIDAVCRGAERLGDRRALPPIRQMHAIPLLRDQQCAGGVQADYFPERRAMLELALARALARCGSAEGYEILARYLGDARSLLGRSALLELRRLSGLDFGRDARRWREWLEAAKPYEETYPLKLELDIERDSASLLRQPG